MNELKRGCESVEISSITCYFFPFSLISFDIILHSHCRVTYFRADHFVTFENILWDAI